MSKPLLDNRRKVVSQNIRLGRQLAGLGQEKFAAMVGVRRQHLSDWERGKYEPTARSLQRIADALERPFGWFYAEHDCEQDDAA
jgi:transcriptional regulator with XRE-family HTH domain